MIWVRRAFAVPLLILFVVLLLASLVIARVDDTAGDADFYNSQMEKADFYNFVYDRALPAVIDEYEEEEAEDAPIHLSKVMADTIETARDILPPDWLRDQFEAATDTFIPYFLGKQDQFTYTFELRERALTASRVLKEDFLQGETFQSIYNDMTAYLAGKMYGNLDQLPFDLQVTEARLESALKQMVPDDWIINQVGPAIDAVTPYFVSDSDQFTVTFEVADRVDDIAQVILEVFATDATYRYLMGELLVPMIEGNLGTAVSLPFGVSLVTDEVSSAIEEVLPPDWIIDRLEAVIWGMADYIKGEADTVAVNIDLTGRKAAAMELLAQQVKDRLGSSYVQMESSLGVTVEEAIEQYIGSQIPDQWVYGLDDLKASMGADNQDILDKGREWFVDGWKFTEVDLLDRLEPDDEDTLADIRDWLGNGYVLTEQDIYDEMDDPGDRDDFDNVREDIDTYRSLIWILGILPFLILIAIGFLAGRGWRGRVYWAFTTLFVVALVLFIALSILKSDVIDSEIEDGFDLEEETGVSLVMLEKGQEMALNAGSSFVSGIRTDLIWMMVFSGLILAGTIGAVIWQAQREGYGDDG